MIELDQRLEFAQVMGVAKRMARAFEGATGFEAVMDDHAAGKRVRHVAPLGRDAIEGKALGCGRVQPLRFAGDPEAVLSIVEGSSRQRTRAAAASAPIRPATGASALAFLRTQSITLAGAMERTPKRSASVSAVLCSGINCCRWR